MPRVTFLPSGQTVEVVLGATLLDAYLRASLPPFSDCAGLGTCGKCRVLVKGEARPPGPLDSDWLSWADLRAGYRLACQYRVYEDTVVEVAFPLARPVFKALEARFQPPLVLSPAVQRLSVGDGREVLTFDGELLGTRPALGRPLLGVALDIGTTTISGYLLDLETGVQEAALAVGNPQAAYGADVISRIAFVNAHPEGLRLLQGLLMSGIEQLLQELARQAERSIEDVLHIVAVGNPTMLHLLLGVEPRPIALPPYQPAFREARRVDASSLGLRVNPWAKVETLPLVSGYVGADSVAMALFLGLDRRGETCLAVDVGTNGEILLSHRGRLYACSAAAGPAFEGASISSGMRAERGAIDSLLLDGETGEVSYHTIGGTRPRGISGSGLIGLVAALLDAGLLLPSGAFAQGRASPLARRLRRRGKGYEFVVARGRETFYRRDITLTQQDVRQLQLAKAAIAAGLRRLLAYAGLGVEELEHIYLAGAFGSHLDPSAARRIGLLPGIPLERVVAVGNAAGGGARMALLSREMGAAARRIADSISYLELSSDPHFSELFIEELAFPS
jgi:uncharacterized 2Fe-2S/4Fe-4S cluster protein (DUF4445 family)